MTTMSGNELPCAADLVARGVVTVRAHACIHDAADLLTSKSVSDAAVLSANGALVGILTQRDCLRVMANETFYQLAGGHVADHMQRDVPRVSSTCGLLKLAERFIEGAHATLPVVDEQGRLLGQVSRADVLTHLAELRRPGTDYPDYRRPS